MVMGPILPGRQGHGSIFTMEYSKMLYSLPTYDSLNRRHFAAHCGEGDEPVHERARPAGKVVPAGVFVVKVCCQRSQCGDPAQADTSAGSGAGAGWAPKARASIAT